MKYALVAFLLAGQAMPLPAQTHPPVSPAPASHAIAANAPGVFAGDYFYLTGQGGQPAEGTAPAGFEEQAQRAFDNVKSALEKDGLSMDNVVYTQVYLDDMQNFAAMNRVYAKNFPTAPPARACLGVAALHDTHILVSAVAIRDAKKKKIVQIPGYHLSDPVSAGILTGDRLFISAIQGEATPAHDNAPDPAAEVTRALDGMQAVVKAAGLDMRHVVFVNPYLTNAIPANTMNKLYAERFEFGNTPARATIQVSSLPRGAHIEYTGVAVVDLAARQVIRPKNMPPSPTASPCVFAGDTLYCSAKSGFIPGVNSGIYTPDVDLQLRQTMRNLLDNLEEAGMDFESMVTGEVYVDNLADMPAIDQLYRTYFKGAAPALTVVQQLPPAERKANERGLYPTFEQISLIAVRKK